MRRSSTMTASDMSALRIARGGQRRPGGRATGAGPVQLRTIRAAHRLRLTPGPPANEAGPAAPDGAAGRR